MRIEASKWLQSARGLPGVQWHSGDGLLEQIQEVANSLMRGTEALKDLQTEGSAPWLGSFQHERAVIDRT